MDPSHGALARDFGSLLRDRRVAAGFSQRKLAGAAGISLAALRDLEQQRSRNPRPPAVQALADVLGLTGEQRQAFCAAAQAGPKSTSSTAYAGSSSRHDIAVTVEILGPLRVRRGDQRIDLTRGRYRVLLARLALGVNTPVSHAELIELLWGTDPPGTAANQLHKNISRLRHLLDPSRSSRTPGDVLTLSAGGYQLNLTEQQGDLTRFRAMAKRARQLATSDQVAAFDLLSAALQLWRGDPLPEVVELSDHSALIALAEERVEAALWCAGLARTAEQHRQCLSALRELAANHLWDEPLHERLIDALAATGQYAAALTAYEDIRARLGEELGVDPGPQLQAAHLRVLRHQQPSSDEQSHASARQAVPLPNPLPLIPAQLPLDVYGFTGRRPELDRLDESLTRADREPTAVIIAVLSGTAGVGKTALAVHWAHQVAQRFPDGQLYINLRGFDAEAQPTPAADVLRRFLGALGQAPEQIPADTTSQVALYRSVLAGKRVLIVLDNARDAGQVRPLLPGAPGCLVLVTSRDTLSGLTVAEGALPIRLDLLTVEEGRDLIARRLGEQRVLTAEDTVRDILILCARLPLALATVAARAAARPGIALSTLAEEIREAGDGLDAFAGSDPATNVRSAFSWSYHALTADAARTFRLSALHPGPVLTIHAAASITGTPLRQTRMLLAELVDSNLITEHAAGQYTIHDLLRAYAGELVRSTDPPADRAAARHRMFDHYVHTTQIAASLLEPHREKVTLPDPEPGIAPVMLSSPEDALAWFETEHSTLVTTVRQAADGGFVDHAWQLAHHLNTYFSRKGHWHDQATAQQTALDITRRLSNRTGQAHAHSGLVRAYFRLARYDEAYQHLREALELYRELGDPLGQARTRTGLAFVMTHRGRYHDSLRELQQAMDLISKAGHPFWHAQALNDIGWNHALLGDYPKALSYCRQALEQMAKLGDTHGQANTHDSLGYAYHHLGDYHLALDHYQQATALFRQCGDRYLEAETLIRYGETLLAMQDHDAARHAWQYALDILNVLHHPDRDTLRGRIDSLTAQHAGPNRNRRDRTKDPSPSI